MNMKEIWKKNEGKLQMKGEWKENEYKMKGTWMQINVKWKEHEVLPKHLKPTKQLLDHRSISEPV